MQRRRSVEKPFINKDERLWHISCTNNNRFVHTKNVNVYDKYKNRVSERIFFFFLTAAYNDTRYNIIYIVQVARAAARLLCAYYVQSAPVFFVRQSEIVFNSLTTGPNFSAKRTNELDFIFRAIYDTIVSEKTTECVSRDDNT